jgi:hypothetical protein
MRHLLLFITMLFSFTLSFAQMPRWPSREEQKALTELEHQYDSLSPMQKMLFLIEIKHIMEPEVKIVQPGATSNDPPADAIILFDGSDINKEWEESEFGFGRGAPVVKPAVTWVIADGAMQSGQRSGSVKTKRSFEDFQLHIEWKTPSEVTGEGQQRGNSGIVIQGIYEVQILDSYDNRTYRNGQAGAVYMQYAPLVNVSRKPGEWQDFDIVYTAPRFKDSTTYFTPPRITIFHNGVLIQNNVSIQGPTVSPGIPQYEIKQHGPGPISLQQHGNPVAFRNIWIREL